MTCLKIDLFLFAAVVAVVTAVFATIDVNAYRAEIAAVIEAETGRKVVFGGDISLSLGRTTILTVKDVRLANVAGGSRPNMLRVAEATAKVDAWLLWRGEIVIQQLVLRGADVLIDIDEQGRTNFDFASAVSARPNDDRGDQTEFLLQRIDDVDIRDAKVTIHDGRNGQTQRLSLQRLRLRDTSAENLMRVAAIGRLDGDGVALPFDLEGRAGRLSALMAGDEPYPVDLQGTVDGVTLAVAGTIADPFAASGLALRVDVSADTLSPFAPLIGEDLPPIGPAHFTASMTGTSAKFSFDDLSFELADSRLSGDLSFDLSGSRLNLDGRLSATWLDLTPWLAADDDMGVVVFDDKNVWASTVIIHKFTLKVNIL